MKKITLLFLLLFSTIFVKAQFKSYYLNFTEGIANEYVKNYGGTLAENFYYSTMPVFPDSTVLIMPSQGDSYNMYIHKCGVVIDPGSPYLLGTKWNNTIPFTVDTITLAGTYLVAPNGLLMDTLMIEVVWAPSTLMSNNVFQDLSLTTTQQTLEENCILNNSKHSNGNPGTVKAPVTNKKVIKYLLKYSDISVAQNYKFIKIPTGNIPIPAGNIIGLSASFIPGYVYRTNDLYFSDKISTQAALNSFSAICYVDKSTSTSNPTNLFVDDNAAEHFSGSQLLYTQNRYGMYNTQYDFLNNTFSPNFNIGIQMGMSISVKMGDPTITASGPATFCAGNSVTLTSSSGSSYLWNNGETTQSIIVDTSGSYNVTITYSNNLSQTTPSTTVTVIPFPSMSISPAFPSVCLGASTTVTVKGADKYSWSPARGLSATTGSSLTANPTASTVYTITGVNSSSNCSAIKTFTINVDKDIPVITASDVEVCSGNPASLTASGSVNYSWSPAKGLASTTGATVIANVNVNTSFTVISTNGCGSIAKSITVTVIASPTVSISGNLSICNGQSTILTASASGGGGMSYLWQPGAIPSQTVNLNISQTYTVIVTGANNCTDTATVFLKDVTLVIAISGNTTICNGETSILTASGASAYTWSTAASTKAITTHPIITTTYSVTGTSNGCSVTASKTITVLDCTGIEDFDASNTINIYPNPNTGKFIISRDDNILLSKPEIIIYDLLGNTVSSLKLSSAQTEIDLSAQAKGIYSIKIFDWNGYVGVRKIIVQ